MSLYDSKCSGKLITRFGPPPEFVDMWTTHRAAAQFGRRSSPMNDTQVWIADIIARQDGLIQRQQAIRAGMTPGQIRHRVTTGRWQVVHPGVYQSTDHNATSASRLRAAGLWAGDHAFLSGHAAAWWWGLTPKAPAIVELVVPRRQNYRSRPGTRVIRRDLHWADRSSVRAARVTGLALSALCGAVALGDEGAAVLDHALQVRVGFAEVRAAHYRTLGIRGSERAGELLRAAADGSAAVSERLFIGLLTSSAIRGWRVNYVWNPPHDERSIDIAFVRERLAIEIDGWAWHHSPDRFQRDRTKQNDLMLAGWTVLRFTWFDLTSKPELVIHEVKRALLTAAAAAARARAGG